MAELVVSSLSPRLQPTCMAEKRQDDCNKYPIQKTENCIIRSNRWSMVMMKSFWTAVMKSWQ